MKNMGKRQRGLSFTVFLLVAVLLIFAAIGGMKLVPAYIEDAEIKNQFNAIVHDPEMQNASVRDIRASFSKRAQVANITAVKAEDIEIGKDASGISLSASYTVKQPLVGNVSLLIEFNPSSK